MTIAALATQRRWDRIPCPQARPRCRSAQLAGAIHTRSNANTNTNSRPAGSLTCIGSPQRILLCVAFRATCPGGRLGLTLSQLRAKGLAAVPSKMRNPSKVFFWARPLICQIQTEAVLYLKLLPGIHQNTEVLQAGKSFVPIWSLFGAGSGCRWLRHAPIVFRCRVSCMISCGVDSGGHGQSK